MLFNSLEFAVFFPAVTALYFICPHRFRTGLLLLASCLFYMALIPRYILILFFLILIDYWAGIAIENASGPRKRLYLTASLIANVGTLAVFKYFGFFAANIADFMRLIHWNYSIPGLSLILPIGLSFHTFQSMSYTIEVYKGRQKTERNILVYALYVLFYPQLVAGPIERPQNLLHQFREEHRFDFKRLESGLKLMIIGFFKKMVIADTLAALVNPVYSNPRGYSAQALAIATYFFAIQIYCDFSGYTDIARGAAEIMGFRLMENFNHPYAAKSVSEFWHRWHISLSTWFRDYLFIPLGGSRVPAGRLYLNLMIVFLVSGFWHGANWTFLAWGALHGFYLIFSILTAAWRSGVATRLRIDPDLGWYRGFKVFVTFNLVALAWIFFRARTMSDAGFIITHFFSGAGQSFAMHDLLLPASLLLLFEAGQFVERNLGFWERLLRNPAWIRWSVYYAIAVATLILTLVNGTRLSAQQFIYFQF